MAIVKVHYVRGKQRIKAHLRYIVHRRSDTGETITRPLFSRDGALSKQHAYELIDATKRGGVFYKFILNFHPTREDTNKDLNLWELTRTTLEHIRTPFGQTVPFIATIHDDHTLLRHVHGFFLVNGRLSKKEFAKIRTLWKIASVAAARQRSRLDRMHVSPRYQKLLPRIAAYQHKRRAGRARNAKPIRMQPGCTQCGFGARDGIPFYLLTCPSCHQWLTRGAQYYAFGRRLTR